MAIVPRGNSTYLVRVYVGRDPLTNRRITINKTVHGSFASARKVEAQLKAQKELGHSNMSPRGTLDMLLDRFLDSRRHLHAASTQNKNRTFLKKYVRPYIGSTSLRKVTCQLLQDLFNLLMDEDDGAGGGGRGLAPNTVKIIRKLLAAAFNYAVCQKLIAENPVLGTRLPPVTESKASCLTFKEAEALESVKDDLWYGNAFVFQLYTGLRPQELMALIWEDVDFERRTLRVERACKWINGVFSGFGTPKTMRSARTIKLGAAPLDLLGNHHRKQIAVDGARETRGGDPKIKEWAQRERPRSAKLYDSAALIFPKPAGGVPNSLIPRLKFKEALRRAGIVVDYRWYDLRHTNASFQIKLGVSLTNVAAKMGHTLAELVHTYAHHIEDERSDVPEWFAKLIPT